MGRTSPLAYMARGLWAETAVWLDFKFKTSLSKPFAVIIEPTLRCPMGCAFCNFPKEALFPKSVELSLETWLRILRELREYNPLIRDVYVAGGEPFLRNDLCDLLAGAHELGYRTRLLTIGVFCTPKICDRLLRSPMEWLRFSILSPYADVHDAFVKRPVFGRATSAIRYLKENGYRGKIGFLTSITSMNVRDVAGIVELARELAIDGVIFRPLFSQTQTIRTFEDQRELPEDCVADPQLVIEAVQTLKRLKSEGAPILNSERQLDQIVEQMVHGRGGVPGCHMMYESVYIRPNGDLEVCGHMTLGRMGNVAQTPVAAALSAREAYAARHRVSRSCRCEANAFLRKTLGEKARVAVGAMLS
jgi:MoaA/NifB/PqqE/SkfB family radical SAM enzyme